MAAVGEIDDRCPSDIFYNDATKKYHFTIISGEHRSSTVIYSDEDRILKLIFPDRDIDTLRRSSVNEVGFQMTAAKYHLGPNIYSHGLIIPGMDLPFKACNQGDENNQGDTMYIPFTFTIPFYYIIMEYYSPHQGWNGPVYVSDNPLKEGITNNELFYQFVNTLVTKAHLANIADPLMHFYYHDDHGLRMIDYGRCIWCYSSDKQLECMKEMCRLVQIKSIPQSRLHNLTLRKRNKPKNGLGKGSRKGGSRRRTHKKRKST